MYIQIHTVQAPNSRDRNIKVCKIMSDYFFVICMISELNITRMVVLSLYIYIYIYISEESTFMVPYIYVCLQTLIWFQGTHKIHIYELVVIGNGIIQLCSILSNAQICSVGINEEFPKPRNYLLPLSSLQWRHESLIMFANHAKFDRLFIDYLFRVTTNKTSMILITFPSWENSTGDQWFHVFVAWCHH